MDYLKEFDFRIKNIKPMKYNEFISKNRATVIFSILFLKKDFNPFTEEDNK